MRMRWTPPTKPSDLEWAKLSSFIDGEGSIGIRCRKNCATPNYIISVVVTNCDPRLIIWIKHTFKVGSVSAQDPNSRSKDSYNRQTSYVWETYSRCAEWILENCLPHFVLKSEQAEICLELGKTMLRTRWRGLDQQILVKRENLKQRLHVLKAMPFPACDVKKVANA
jgi:hypothetical protein